MNPPAINRRRFLRIAAVNTVALSVFGNAVRAAESLDLRRWRGVALGGEVSIDLYGGADDSIFVRCREEMMRLEGIFSLYDDRSSLSQLNREGELSSPPPELVEVLQLARRVSEASDGAFDVTVHPLCELLATGETDEGRIAVARDLVDYRKVRLDRERLAFDHPDMRVTLNGVAQGYITDRITDLLAKAGYRAALVDIGEQRALGNHPQNRPWRLGVRAPDGSGFAGVVDLLAGQALATSGGYGQVYASGQRHHLLDAREGRSRRDWTSVSVIAPTAAEADALSTALAVSEPSRAPAILASISGASARVLTSSGALLDLAPL